MVLVYTLISLFLMSNASLNVSATPESGVSNHYYVELKGNEAEDYSFQFGNVRYEENGTPVRMEFQSKNLQSSKEQLLKNLNDRLLSLPAEKQNILVYIHGMWAHQPHYWKAHARKLQKGIFEKEQNPYGLVVSLIWECGMNYKSNVPLAYNKGKAFSSVVQEVVAVARNLEDTKISMLCHSMGNRVMQGFYEEIQMEYEQPPFHNILMAGADLESDIFEKDKPLENIDRFTENVTIYVHNNDRSLKMSKLLNENDRLGLQGVSDISKVSEIIEIVDVSIVTDNESFASKMSNHRYFCESPTVRQDILNCLCKNDEHLTETRKPLRDPRSFMLLFGDEKRE